MTGKFNRLFSEFRPVTTAEWEELIATDLKGKDYEKTLVWRTNEGISVKPYYRAENLADLEYLENAPGQFPFVRGNYAENQWLIRQDFVVDDYSKANLKALDALQKGANSIGFILDGKNQFTVENLSELLKDICLTSAEINLICTCPDCNLTEIFSHWLKNSGADLSEVMASVGNDPLGNYILKGKSDSNSEETTFENLKKQVEQVASMPKVRVVTVNGRIYGNSGASVVQELAFSLAQGVEYLTRLTELGVAPDEAASRIKFNLGIGNNYFLEMAKLRAGRLLWAQIVKAFGAKTDNAARMMVHAETSAYNKTVYDAHTNLLRTQTETMSAALGGAYSITALPFDKMYQEPGSFSERIARNQQILLKEEANIDKIADPASGAYYIENLTASVADAAWKLFLEVQDKGGFLSSIKDGFVQKQVKEMAARRDANIALRRENLLGINQFPNFSEVISTELPAEVFQPAGQSFTDADIETLKPYRGAAALEALRYKTDRYAAANGRPVAFMLTMGNLAMRKARAQFACNFFAVAGFEVIDNNGFETIDEALSEAQKAKAKIMVACSSDEEYAEIVPELAAKIKDAILVVAGNPACRPELEAVGVTNYIHIRSNLIEELQKFQKMLNI